MAETSTIEWTDATWNPITGCTLVSEGCRHCYAARLAATRLKHLPSRAGLARVNAAGEAKFTGEVRLNEDWLDQPLRWRRPFGTSHPIASEYVCHRSTAISDHSTKRRTWFVGEISGSGQDPSSKRTSGGFT